MSLDLHGRSWILLIMLSLLFAGGCAEGLFWKTGYLSPWVRQKWADEEQIAPSLYAHRAQLRETVTNAINSGDPQQTEAVSQHLAEIATKDPVLLLRIEAVRLLGTLPTESSARALRQVANDRQIEVRRVAISSLVRLGDPGSGQVLAELAQHDPDIDIRVSATAALGGFSEPFAVEALDQVIRDPDPALQLRAAQSLGSITGQGLGNDIRAWQAYLDGGKIHAEPSRIASESTQGSGSSVNR